MQRARVEQIFVLQRNDPPNRQHRFGSRCQRAAHQHGGVLCATCGRLGGSMAAEVISHIGPRPDVSLKELANRSGFSV